MNTTKQEKAIKELFVGKCWNYLDDNFHKFKEYNKIKVALELCKKDIYSPLIDQSSHLHLTNNINLEEFRKLPVQDKIRDILNRK